MFKDIKGKEKELKNQYDEGIYNSNNKSVISAFSPSPEQVMPFKSQTKRLEPAQQKMNTKEKYKKYRPS